MNHARGPYPRWVVIVLLLAFQGFVVSSRALAYDVPLTLPVSGFCPEGGTATLTGTLHVTPTSPTTAAFEGTALLQFSDLLYNLADCGGFFGPGLRLSGSVSVGIINGHLDSRTGLFTASCMLHSNALSLYRLGLRGGLDLVQDLGSRTFATVDCHEITNRASPPVSTPPPGSGGPGPGK